MELPAEHSLRNIILLMMKIKGELCSDGMNLLYFSESESHFPVLLWSTISYQRSLKILQIAHISSQECTNGLEHICSDLVGTVLSFQQSTRSAKESIITLISSYIPPANVQPNCLVPIYRALLYIYDHRPMITISSSTLSFKFTNTQDVLQPKPVP